VTPDAANLHLYRTDKAAWLRQGMPRIVANLRADIAMWGRMARDTQVAVWQHLDADLRERVRRSRATTSRF